MTVMCIEPCGEIGLEVHPETDQVVRVEQGRAVVTIGESRCRIDFEQMMCPGDVVFIPAGCWHNVVNVSGMPLKISVIYAPPNHPRGTVQLVKDSSY